MKFAGPMAHWRARSWVWLFGCRVEPPPTPSRRASGPPMSIPKPWHGFLGGPFCDFFSLRFWASFWIRFGFVLGSSWRPFGRSNRAKLGPECVLKRSFFEKIDVHKIIVKPMEKPRLLTPRRGPRSTQDRSKAAPRGIKK